jgi:WD40 repeat protein
VDMVVPFDSYSSVPHLKLHREQVSRHDFECLTVLNKHTQDVKFVAFHPTRLCLFSTSYDDSIRVSYRKCGHAMTHTLKVWAEYDDDWHEEDVLLGHTSTVSSTYIPHGFAQSFVSFVGMAAYFS